MVNASFIINKYKFTIIFKNTHFGSKIYIRTQPLNSRKKETEFSNTIEFVCRQQLELLNVLMRFNVNVRKTFIWKGKFRKKGRVRERKRKERGKKEKY